MTIKIDSLHIENELMCLIQPAAIWYATDRFVFDFFTNGEDKKVL